MCRHQLTREGGGGRWDRPRTGDLYACDIRKRLPDRGTADGKTRPVRTKEVFRGRTKRNPTRTLRCIVRETVNKFTVRKVVKEDQDAKSWSRSLHQHQAALGSLGIGCLG